MAWPSLWFRFVFFSFVHALVCAVCRPCSCLRNKLDASGPIPKLNKKETCCFQREERESERERQRGASRQEETKRTLKKVVADVWRSYRSVRIPTLIVPRQPGWSSPTMTIHEPNNESDFDICVGVALAWTGPFWASFRFAFACAFCLCCTCAQPHRNIHAYLPPTHPHNTACICPVWLSRPPFFFALRCCSLMTSWTWVCESSPIPF